MIQLRALLFAFTLYSSMQTAIAHPRPANACPFGAAGDTIDLACRKKAEQLLDEALTFMEQSYYRRNEVSWPQLISDAKSRLREAATCEDAYGTISWCFRQLKEPHSFLMPPDAASRYKAGSNDFDSPTDLSRLVGEIKGEWLQDSIAYLTIPWVSTDDSLLCQRIADSIQTVIARLDTRKITRWIIDLRQNSGGNCWPMLTGVAPLLGEGCYGYFVSSTTGKKIPITYHDGSAFQGRHEICRVSRQGYRTRADRKSIVVLTSHKTVSAGELVALAFKGREQTCLIGEPTAGLTTANATYTLSDRSMLVLTVCQEADRNGLVCQGSVIPDKLVSAKDPDVSASPRDTANSPADAVKNAAVAWLQTR